MTNPSGRALLGVPVGGAVAATTGLPATAHAASWKLRRSPSTSSGGLGAFEAVEDDRADSHPAEQPHILAEGGCPHSSNPTAPPEIWARAGH